LYRKIIYFIMYLWFNTDEWKNFLERVGCNSEEELRANDVLEEELRLWASYRSQTLTKTGRNLSPATLTCSICVSFWEIIEQNSYFDNILTISILCFSAWYLWQISTRNDVLPKSFGTSSIPWYGKWWRYLAKAWL
jgi:hypothetical protein